jgi:SulP family sulfate permease
MLARDKSKFLKDFVPKSWICLKDYSWSTFRRDLLAGMTVGIVALPLAMAFAIASGVAPEKGLYTAIIAGFLISLLGGSKVQIGGPTGAFVVIVYGIIQRQGYEGLVVATLMAGILLIVMGLCRLGNWIKFIPYPLITGFTSGIAVIILFSQVKNFLGLKMGTVPANFIDQLGAYFQALPTFDALTFGVGAGTLAVILLIRRFIPSIPWGIASIVLATFACWVFSLAVGTIESQFGAIPRTLPSPGLSGLMPSLLHFHLLIPDALVIAFLAGIESLLSAVVADGMTGGRHKSNCELVAQGFANIGSMFFGGIPATGAIARTATNVKTGARTPVAGMIHAATLFLIILAFAPLVGKIPLPALSAVLVMVAWNMSEIGHFRRILRAPRGDIVVLLTTFLLTVAVDLTVGVGVGLVLAVFLFMKRMSEIPAKVFATPRFEEEPEKTDPDAIAKKHIPDHVEVYEINGPFFFGVADSLKDILSNLEKPPKVFILRLRKVPLIDATGMHALREFYDKCKKDHTLLILSGVHGHLQETIEKFGLDKLIGKENIFPHIDLALARSSELLLRDGL